MARKSPFTDDQFALLEAALMHVPFDGFGDKSLAMAAEDMEISLDAAKRLVPGGAAGLVDMFMSWGDMQMQERAAALPLDEMKIRERIAVLVKTRLQVIDDHPEAVRRGIGIMMMPGISRTRMAATGLWRTADVIWHLAGDTATDYNYYSKRSLLTGVYISTLAFWLNDASTDKVESWAFLDQRIDNVMQIQKLKGKFGKGPNMPSSDILKHPVTGLLRKGLARAVGAGPVMRDGGGNGDSDSDTGSAFKGPFGIMAQLRREFGGP